MLEIPSSAARPPSSSTSTCTCAHGNQSMSPPIPGEAAGVPMRAHLDEDGGVAVLLCQRLKRWRYPLARPTPDGREICATRRHRVGCLRSLTGATAGAERSAPTTTSLSPASSCKASHSPSAKVRAPPRRRSSSGAAAGATQPRAAVLPCWRDGCGASCGASCDASCDASESGAVATRSTHAARMAEKRGAEREGHSTRVQSE